MQPKYSIDPPQEVGILPHIEWAEDQLYYEVWHVEVYEQRRGTWKKWLPRGSFQGRTKVVYEFPGVDLPPIPELRKHHLYRQPYVLSMEIKSDDPIRIKMVYDSVDPQNISRNVSQFSSLVQDTLFRTLNPEADVQYEVFTVEGKEGKKTYARLFNSNVSEPITEQ